MSSLRDIGNNGACPVAVNKKNSEGLWVQVYRDRTIRIKEVLECGDVYLAFWRQPENYKTVIYD